MNFDSSGPRLSHIEWMAALSRLDVELGALPDTTQRLAAWEAAWSCFHDLAGGDDERWIVCMAYLARDYELLDLTRLCPMDAELKPHQRWPHALSEQDAHKNMRE